MPVKETGVIYLQRDKFQIYTTVRPIVLEFHFVPDIVRDLDVVNKELFENIIKIFIESNKILPCNLTIVLADNVCFIKDFAQPDKPPAPAVSPRATQEQKQAQTKEKDEFLAHIPFEIVASIEFQLQNGERIFATNQDLYDAIKTTFEKNDFSIDSVIPGGLYGNNISSQPILTPAAANLILQTTPALKQYNMLIQSMHEPEKKENENEKEETETQEIQKPKKDKKRLIVISVVFGILIIVLIFVYMSANQNPTSSAQETQPVSSVQTITNPPPLPR